MSLSKSIMPFIYGVLLLITASCDQNNVVEKAYFCGGFDLKVKSVLEANRTDLWSFDSTK